MKLSPEQKEARRLERQEAWHRRQQRAAARKYTDFLLDQMPVKPRQVVKVGKPSSEKPEAWQFKFRSKKTKEAR